MAIQTACRTSAGQIAPAAPVLCLTMPASKAPAHQAAQTSWPSVGALRYRAPLQQPLRARQVHISPTQLTVPAKAVQAPALAVKVARFSSNGYHFLYRPLPQLLSSLRRMPQLARKCFSTSTPRLRTRSLPSSSNNNNNNIHQCIRASQATSNNSKPTTFQAALACRRQLAVSLTLASMHHTKTRLFLSSQHFLLLKGSSFLVLVRAAT